MISVIRLRVTTPYGPALALYDVLRDAVVMTCPALHWCLDWPWAWLWGRLTLCGWPIEQHAIGPDGG